jgi:hypothetical protein
VEELGLAAAIGRRPCCRRNPPLFLPRAEQGLCRYADAESIRCSHGSCDSRPAKGSGLHLPEPHAPPQGPRAVPVAGLRRAQWLHQGRRVGGGARLRAGRPAVQGDVPAPVPLQAPEGEVHRRGGHVLGAVRVLRQEGDAVDRQRAAAEVGARGSGGLQRGAPHGRSGGVRAGVGRLRHRGVAQRGQRNHPVGAVGFWGGFVSGAKFVM